jgi:hypothetical protein
VDQRWRGGTTVSSSSPAFGWKCQRRSEAWEWRKKEITRPLAPRVNSSAQSRANAKLGRSVWSLPQRQLGGGRAVVARAWRAQGTPGRERSRGGRGKGRRVGMYRSWRWSSGRGAGGKRRWQERNRGGSGGARGRRSREVSGGLVCDFRKVQGPLCKLKFLTTTKVK